MRKTILLDGKAVEYELEYKNVRNINLRVKPDGQIHVYANRLHPISSIEKLIKANAGMILRTVSKAENARNQAIMPRAWATGEKIVVLGRAVEIEVRNGARNGGFTEEGKLVLLVRDPGNENMRRKTAEKWMKELCAETVGRYCRKYYPFFSTYCRPGMPQIQFRKMKSRWGSCRPRQNALTFNICLVHLPEECIEYVVVHEFSHFVHPNHSADFYGKVSEFVPDWRRLRSRIREYEILLV